MEKYLHMRNVGGGRSVLSQFILFCREICFVALEEDKIVLVEKNYKYQVDSHHRHITFDHHPLLISLFKISIL